MRWIPSNAPESRTPSNHRNTRSRRPRCVSDFERFRSVTQARRVGGSAPESLRAIAAEGGAKTPAKIGSAEVHRCRASAADPRAEKLTWTNRKSASRSSMLEACLSGWRSRRCGTAWPWTMGAGGEPAGLVDHRANCEIVGPGPDSGRSPYTNRNSSDTVCCCGEQVAPEAEQVAVARIQTCDRASAHQRHLVGDSDALKAARPM